MLEDYVISGGIKIILLRVGGGLASTRTVHFSTNIRLLDQNCLELSYHNDHFQKHTTSGKVTELLAQNLIEYALEQWNMEVKQVLFKPYSITVTIDALKDLELLQMAVRRMCLSLINVYRVNKGNPLLANTNAESTFELLPRDEISSKILPDSYIQMNELEKVTINIEINNLIGIEDVQVRGNLINFSIAYAFATRKYIDELSDRVADIIRKNWTPNVLFTDKSSFDLNTLVRDSR